MQADKLNKEFAKAYDDYADAIFRHCYFRVSDREKAKDLMQETFIRTWDYIAKGNKVRINEIKPFLYKTASNLIIDEYRKKKNNTSLDNLRDRGFEIEVESDIEQRVEIQIEVNKIRDILAKLDKNHRDIVVMRYIDGLTPKEIAKITDDTANNVSVKLNRAIKQIREIIKNER